MVYVALATTSGLVAWRVDDSAAYPWLVMGSLPFGAPAGGLSWNLDALVRQDLGTGLSTAGSALLSATTVGLYLMASVLNGLLLLGMLRTAQLARRRFATPAGDPAE